MAGGRIHPPGDRAGPGRAWSSPPTGPGRPRCWRGRRLTSWSASDAAAAEFVHSPLGRTALRIPDGAEPVLEPRLVVAKDYYHRSPDGVVWPVTVREGLLKVWWTVWEESGAPPAACPPRAISVGTTLSWDWDSGRVRVLLTTDRADRPAEAIADPVRPGPGGPGPSRGGHRGRPARGARGSLRLIVGPSDPRHPRWCQSLFCQGPSDLRHPGARRRPLRSRRPPTPPPRGFAPSNPNSYVARKAYAILTRGPRIARERSESLRA